MINSKKKGFTIVELVIVIAVVAILAAVLIPTFSNLVKKANLSADQQAVRQMNTALAIYAAENERPSTAAEAKKALDSQLINVEGGLVPVSKGYAFYWDSSKNEVVLVATGDEIKDGWEILTSNAFGKLIEVSSENDLKTTVTSANEPVSITLTSNITTSKETYFKVNNGQVIEIDLNGNTLTFDDNATYEFYIASGGHLAIKNGTINGSSKVTHSFINKMGTLNLTNVVIQDHSLQTAIYFEGISDTSIVSCTINSSGPYAITTNSSTDSSDGVRVSIIDSTIVSTHSEGTGILINTVADITIDGCTVVGARQGMFLRGNNAVIKNSSFECTFDPNEEDPYTNSFESGNAGPIASITLHAGGAYGGDATFNYVFENVTADTIVAGTTENGKIIVSGVNPTRIVTGSNVTVK